jgi:adenylate cyclase class 2
MSNEVEQKFVLENSADLLARLEALGARPTGEHQQRDRYFNHPARDFAATDEALRIRSTGEKNVVTYKGPKLSTRSKTRRELETPLGAGAAAADRFASTLVALGFTPVAVVEKTRRTFELVWEGHRGEIACDQVRDVGLFAEIEFLGAETDGADISSLEDILFRLAERLGLAQVERRSYFELLLALRARS